LCAARACRLILAKVVRDEVEEILFLHAERLPALDAAQLIAAYHRLVKLANPEFVPYPNEHLVRSSLSSGSARTPTRVNFASGVAKRKQFPSILCDLSELDSDTTEELAERVFLRVAKGLEAKVSARRIEG